MKMDQSKSKAVISNLSSKNRRLYMVSQKRVGYYGRILKASIMYIYGNLQAHSRQIQVGYR